MERKAKVKFWLDNSDNLLHVQNLATSEIKMIKNQMQIALFLNEHRLTVNDLRGSKEGYDVLNLFTRKKILNMVPFLHGKKDS